MKVDTQGDAFFFAFPTAPGALAAAAALTEALRYFLDGEDDLPGACPQCGGALRHRCPSCSAPIPSAFAVDCEECGAPVRDAELFGSAIRRPGR